MTSHIKTVGVLNLVFGGLTLLGGLGILLFFVALGGLAGYAVSQQKAGMQAAREKQRADGEAPRRAGGPEENGGEDPVVIETGDGEGGGAGGTDEISDEEAGLVAAGIMGLVGLVAGGGLILWGIVRVLVGIGLMRVRGWGRIGGIVVGVLDLPNFPLGTAFGVYALWALLAGGSREAFLSAR